ncbi:MAG: hldE [Aeromicrobium sp.]|nr:hldE [Aeromicrobium sp.]
MSRVVVVGEALLDVDLDGVARRLSPESPVPVLDDLVEHDRPGGAALAAAMIGRDGHDVVLVSPLAADDAGDRLRALLDGRVAILALPARGGTPVKRRVRAGGHNVVRLDEGGSAGACAPEAGEIGAALDGADVVLVSDYGRGLTHDPDVRELLGAAGRRVPLVWDPHPRGAAPVSSSVVVTPNEDEVAGLIRPVTTVGGGHVGRAAVRAAEAVSALGVRAVAVTLGSRGALLSFGDGPPEAFTARPVSGDACGAGDRFAAALAVSLAGGRLLSESVAAAVEAATTHVENGGAAGFAHPDVSLPAEPPAGAAPDAVAVARRARARGETLIATGGCFDLLHAGHVAMLESARALGDRLVVLLNSDESVSRLKGPGRPLTAAADRARVLGSLACVDAVLVFDEDTPAEAIELVRPDIWVKGGDYAGRRLPEEDVLGAWGGHAVVVPYLQGRSTSGLVRSMTR